MAAAFTAMLTCTNGHVHESSMQLSGRHYMQADKQLQRGLTIVWRLATGCRLTLAGSC